MPSTAARITTVDARDNFSDLLNRTAFGKERVVLTRRGKPLVAMVPIEDIETLEALEDRRDAAEIKAALAEFRASGEEAIPLDEVARRRGLKRQPR